MVSFRRFLCGIIILALMAGCSARPPLDHGVRDGELLPCPDTPNCVSSLAEESSDKFVLPLEYKGKRENAIVIVKHILKKLGNASIEEEKPDYLWVECKSKLMGFIDDLEFFFPEDGNKVHIRSASRMGYSDLGANKKRVEKIRGLFNDL